MEVEKIITQSKYPALLNLETDVENNGTLIIMSEPRQVTTRFGEKKVINVQTTGGELRSMFVNNKSWNAIWDTYGADTLDWVGKPMRVMIGMTPTGNNMAILKAPKA